MIAALVAGITLCSCEKNQTTVRTSEKTVIIKNNIEETIEKYIFVRRILLTEFYKVKQVLNTFLILILRKRKSKTE